ncbi:MULTISPECIES: AsmA family protein [unclassified Nitrospina]|uniref:AsmA family protein n=1 Tax=unclassified Nitrospina TaxID=2638683 RepID=UPI003F9A9E78
MPFSKKKLFLRLLVAVLLLCVGVGALLYLRLSDEETVKGMVIAELEYLVGQPVTLESVKVDIEEDGLGLRLNRLRLLNTDAPEIGGQPQIEFSAQSVWIGFRILPFLSKQQVSIHSVEVEGADIQLVRDREGRLPFSKSVSSDSTQGQNAAPSMLWMSTIRSIEMEQSTLRWIDHSVPDSEGSPSRVTLHSVNLALSRPLLAAKVKLKMEAAWSPHKLNEPDLSLEGEVDFAGGFDNLGALHYSGRLQADRLRSERLRPYWEQALKFEMRPAILRLRSNFSGTWGTILEASGTLEHQFDSGDETPSLTTADAPPAGGFEYDVVWTPGALEVRQAGYTMGDFRFQVQGALTPFPAADPGMAFRMRASPLSPAQLDETFPFHLIPQEVRSSALRYWKSGQIEVESAAFRGGWNELQQILAGTLSGKLSVIVNLDNVNGDGELAPFKAVTGRLEYDEGRAMVKLERARWKKVTLTNIDSVIRDFTTEPHMKTQLEAHAKIDDLVALARTLEDAGSLKKALQSIQQASGESETQLTLSGPLLSPAQWAVQGESRVREASFQAGSMMSPFQKIEGTVAFQNALAGESQATRWTLRFVDFSAECRNHRFHDVSGITHLSAGAVKTELTAQVDLGALQSKQFIPATAVSGSFGRLLSKMEVSDGTLNIEYREERFADPKKQTRMSGTVRFDNVSFLYRDRFRPLRKVTGSLSFDGHKVSFETSEARYGDSGIRLQGTFFNPGEPKAELVLKATASDFQKQDFIDVPFLETLPYEGVVQVESVLHWTKRSVTLKSSIDLTGASYSYRDLLAKPEAVPNTIETVMVFSDQDGIDFKTLAVGLNGNRVSGTATLVLEDPTRFEFKLGASGFEVASLSPYIKPLRGARAGVLDFDISGKGLLDQPESANYQGRIELREVRFAPEQVPMPVWVNGELFFANRVVKVTKGRVTLGKTPLTIEGKLVATEQPEWDLNVSGKALDMTQFKKESVPDSSEPTGAMTAGWTASPWFQQGSGSLKINLARLTIPRAHFHDFQGTFRFERGTVSTDTLRWGRKGRDRFDVSAVLKTAPEQSPELSAHIVSTGTRAEGFFNVFGGLFENCLTGTLERLEARVSARGSSLPELTRTLNGTLVLRVRNGQIQTGRLLNGTIQLFGYSLEPEKAAKRRSGPFEDYKVIKGDFALKDGVAVTENFIFENPKQLMTLVGSFDLNARNMDTTVGVAPWRAVDSFFKKIPLVGKIITAGEEESVFKSYYQIRGPFENPEVKTVPITSLGKKVVGMFGAILRTPQYILSGDKEQTGQN